MTDPRHPALLPSGFHDVLPPEAAHEAAVIERLMAILAGHGYERVRPPLAEFEETLLSGTGVAMADESFRLMDPISRHMMAVRADMTLQVARIARTRLGRMARPLRLAYAGQVLRVRGSQLRPLRQFAQVGAELIGAEAPEADAEVALIAAEALAAIGVERLSIDLNLPTLVPALCAPAGLEPGRAAALRRALDRKDMARVGELGGAAAPLLTGLLEAGGPAGPALTAAKALDLPAAAAAELDHLDAVARHIMAAAPDLAMTIDFVEHRGFEYHSGVSFTLFARGLRSELGRGGRYHAGNGNAPGAAPGAAAPLPFAAPTAFGAPVPAAGSSEAATGFTLFMDSVLRAAPPGTAPRRVYLPGGTPPEVGRRLRAEDWVTVAGLAPADTDPAAEAARLGCGFVLAGGTPRPVGA